MKLDERLIHELAPFTKAVFGGPTVDTVEFFGSGALLSADDRFYLLSAAHVLDRASDKVPLFINVENGLLPLEGLISTSITSKPCERSDDRLDFGVPAFPQSRNATLRQESFLTLENLDLDHRTDPTFGFAFIGHPVSKNRRAVEETTKTISAFTYGAMCMEASSASYEKMSLSSIRSLLLTFNAKGVFSLAGEKRTAPALHGLSGAPIWRITADGTAKVVAILTEHHKGERKCVVATRIDQVLVALKSLQAAESNEDSSSAFET